MSLPIPQKASLHLCSQAAAPEPLSEVIRLHWPGFFCQSFFFLWRWGGGGDFTGVNYELRVPWHEKVYRWGLLLKMHAHHSAEWISAHVDFWVVDWLICWLNNSLIDSWLLKPCQPWKSYERRKTMKQTHKKSQNKISNKTSNNKLTKRTN